MDKFNSTMSYTGVTGVCSFVTAYWISVPFNKTGSRKSVLYHAVHTEYDADVRSGSRMSFAVRI